MYAYPAATELSRTGSRRRRCTAPRARRQRRALVRGWPAECTCPPLQPQAWPWPQDNEHRW